MFEDSKDNINLFFFYFFYEKRSYPNPEITSNIVLAGKKIKLNNKNRKNIILPISLINSIFTF